MLNVVNRTNDKDDISNMLAAARRQTNVEIQTLDPSEGLYHKAMSRRKSLAQEDLINAFTLPPTPSDSDDDTTTSDDSSDQEENKSDVTEWNGQIEYIKKPQRKKQFYSSSTFTKVENSENSRVEMSASKKRSTRKISFLKPRSSSQYQSSTQNASSRFRKMSRRISFSHIMNPTENEALETPVKQVQNRSRSRRTSLPVISLLQSTREVREDEIIHENEQITSKISEPETKAQSNRKFKISRKKPERSVSLESKLEDNAKKNFLEIESGSHDFLSSVDYKIDEADVEAQQDFTSDEEESGRMDMRLNDGSDSNDFDSANDDKRRKSVKNVFKKSFFMSKKSKKKNSFANEGGSSNREPSYERRRRPSRLEMGIPIEEVFAGIEFKTIEKSETPSKESDDENDVVEDPDVLIKSLEADDQRKKSSDFNSDQEKLEKEYDALNSEKSDFEPEKEVEA